MNRILKLTVALLLVSTLVFGSASVFAEDGTSGDGSTDSTTSDTMHGRPIVTAAAETAQEKVAAAKAKACDNKKRVITNIENRIASRGQKRMDVISKIAERVEQFYTNKNLSVSNYDGLVADVNAKKANVQTTLDTIKADAANVSTVTCGEGHGSMAVTQFKTDLKAEQAALKAYHTSVKNLLVAVKTAVGSSSTEGSQ